MIVAALFALATTASTRSVLDYTPDSEGGARWLCVVHQDVHVGM